MSPELFDPTAVCPVIIFVFRRTKKKPLKRFCCSHFEVKTTSSAVCKKDPRDKLLQQPSNTQKCQRVGGGQVTVPVMLQDADEAGGLR